MKLNIRRTALSMLVGVIVFNGKLTPAYAADGTWSSTNNGFWTTAGNWASSIIADGTGFTASFTSELTGDRTVTLNADRTIGNITFIDGTTSSNNLAIAGNILTLDVTTGSPTINVTQSDRTLTISSQLQGSDGLTKAGSGTLTLSGNNLYGGATTVSTGVLIASSNTALGDTTGQTSVASGARVELANGVTVTGETITIIGNGTNFNGALQTSGTTNSATWAGSVILGGSDSRLGTGIGGTLTVSGAVTGSNPLTISAGTLASLAQTGTVVLSAAAGSNTYSGGTLIVRGTLKLGATDTLPTNTTLTVGNGPINENMIFDLNGFNQTVGGLQRTGTSGTGVSYVTNSSGTIKTLTVNQSSTTTYSGLITANLALTKSGNGILNLSGANTFAGPVTVNGGTLKAGVASVTNVSGAFGNNTAVTMANNATAVLDITGFNTQIGSLSGGGATGGNVTLGAATLSVGGDNSSPAAYAGVIAGTGGLTKIGSGTQTLSGANTYTGNTTLAAGKINLGIAENANVSGPLGKQLANAAGTIILNGGTLQHSAANTNDYSGRFSTAASQAYKIDTNGQAVTWATPLTSSGGTLIKSGTGSLTLSGANTYTGGTTVSAGTLIVSNSSGTSATGSGTVTVGNTATLGGSGFIGGNTTIQAGGTVSPGNSPGIMTYNNANLIWNGNGNYNWQVLNATHTSPVSGTDYDTINITGTGILDLSSLTASPTFKINLWSLSSLPNNSGNAANWDATQIHTWTLVSTPNSISGFDPAKFTINAGANNGTAGFSNGLSGGSFSVALTDSGTDLSLIFTPSTTSTTYTLAAAPGTLNILKGGNLPATSTIANTGSGTADTLSYTTLSGTSGNNSTATATGSSSGGPLANGGASFVQNLVVNGINNGNTTITSSVASATNTNLASPASLNGTAGTVNVVVGNASFDGTDSSTTFGTPLSTTVNAGANLTNVNLSSNSITATVTGSGAALVGTTATIVNYSNTEAGNSNETVSMAWRSRTLAEAELVNNPTALLSDVVRITGMGTGADVGTFLLTMSYDLDQTQFAGLNENSIAISGELKLAWLDDGNWVNAILGNDGGIFPAAPVLGAPTGSEPLGTWGVDTSGAGGAGYVWAVLNHNSDFAVIPEPSTLVVGCLALCGFAVARLRRQRTA